ncbi:MAG TPA: 16S rRNA (guanine(527)-N(7))-methyltransferase RsmG [Rhodothermales bacterium]|nr:16S rRNA (guanine(527)-N(7))-methyltransferase RsmG [Rhodothermales bacterium]
MSGSFSEPTATQHEQLAAYARLLKEFNRKINLISRESEAEIDIRHIRHVLALASKPFPSGSIVVDWGTGGGLPAIPLAICFPDVTVHAVDSVGKKVHAVQAMARRLGLTNLKAWHGRAEQWPGRTHYSVSRATAPLVDLWTWHTRVAEPFFPPPDVEMWQPGLICLKGGDLRAEIDELHLRHPDVGVTVTNLDSDSFEEKVIVEVANAT